MTRSTAKYQGHAGIQLLNRALSLPGVPRGDLSFDAIIQAAERSTRLSDWGAPDYLDRLRFSLERFEGGQPLSPLGQLSASIVASWHASNRLRIIDYVKRHPEVRSIPIEKPIFIVGWFRTGTTSLHNLLSLDPSHRVPQSWELCYPVQEHANPRRDRQRRYRRTATKWHLANWVAPEQKYAHALRADSAEECFFMLANSAVSLQQVMGFQGYQYARELMKQDLTRPYQELRLQYQILASQRPGNQWVMKCPLHLWHLDSLLAAFPDARIIQTHRTAAEAVPSVCSLTAIMSRPFTQDFRPGRHGAFFREFYREGVARSMKVRAQLSANQIFDVRLGDLDSDPVDTMRSIYHHFGLEWDEDRMPTRIREHLAREKRASSRHGHRHSYTPEEFGLTASGLREEFGDYESIFLV